MFLPPMRISLEKTKLVLRKLVRWHFMLVLAASLGKGTDTLMYPFVAIYFGSSMSAGCGVGQARAEEIGCRRRSDDNVVNS